MIFFPLGSLLEHHDRDLDWGRPLVMGHLAQLEKSPVEGAAGGRMRIDGSLKREKSIFL